MADLDPKIRRRNRLILTALCGVAFVMVVLAFASVPLYRLFCQVTGYGGTTQVADAVAGKVLRPQGPGALHRRHRCRPALAFRPSRARSRSGWASRR